MGELFPDRFGSLHPNWSDDDLIQFTLPDELMARLDEARCGMSRSDAVATVVTALLKGTAEVVSVKDRAAREPEPEVEDLDEMDFSQEYFELVEGGADHAGIPGGRIVAGQQAGRRDKGRRNARFLIVVLLVGIAGSAAYNLYLARRVDGTQDVIGRLMASRDALQREVETTKADANELVLKLAHVERSLERARAEIEMSLGRSNSSALSRRPQQEAIRPPAPAPDPVPTPTPQPVRQPAPQVVAAPPAARATTAAVTPPVPRKPLPPLPGRRPAEPPRPIAQTESLPARVLRLSRPESHRSVEVNHRIAPAPAQPTAPSALRNAFPVRQPPGPAPSPIPAPGRGKLTIGGALTPPDS